MSEPAVRPATVADADEIAAVHVRSWQAAYRGLMPQEYLDGLDPARTGEVTAIYLHPHAWGQGLGRRRQN